MKQLMVIEDDPTIGEMMERFLRKEGYEVVCAYSGSEALLLLQRMRPDLILLDLMLPGVTGEKVLEAIHGIPVIVVSARADIDDKVRLLENGAADYITKPFDMRELLARIAVQLRKKAFGIAKSRLELNGLSFDYALRTVSYENQSVKLTPSEAVVLKLLMLNPDQVMTKSELLNQLNLETLDGLEESLKVHICHLRAKLKRISGWNYVETVFGIGIKFQRRPS